MIGPALAMSTQVTTALLSGGVALVVALLGIAGAIAAQTVASNRAYENSRKTFREQNVEQERVRAEEVRRQERARAQEIAREDARRFAEQQRTAYVEVLRAADGQQKALSVAERAAEILERIQKAAKSSHPEDPPAGRTGNLDRGQREAVYEAYKVFGQKFDTLQKAVDELELLASGDVLQAARELREVARRAGGNLLTVSKRLGDRYLLSPAPLRELRWLWLPFVGHPNESTDNGSAFWQARCAFVDAARNQLGISGLDVQPPPAQDGTVPR